MAFRATQRIVEQLGLEVPVKLGHELRHGKDDDFHLLGLWRFAFPLVRALRRLW